MWKHHNLFQAANGSVGPLYLYYSNSIQTFFSVTTHYIQCIRDLDD